MKRVENSEVDMKLLRTHNRIDNNENKAMLEFVEVCDPVNQLGWNFICVYHTVEVPSSSC